VIFCVKFVGEGTVASTFIQTKRSRIQVGNHLLNWHPNHIVSIMWLSASHLFGMFHENQP
jgi:hypothetical protein